MSPDGLTEIFQVHGEPVFDRPVLVIGLEGWVDAVRRHRPQTVSLVPAALRMVLEADVDPDDLRSVRSVVSGLMFHSAR